MSANTNNWAPPVQFHFSVVFKLPSGDTATARVKEIEDSVYLYKSDIYFAKIGDSRTAGI